MTRRITQAIDEHVAREVKDRTILALASMRSELGLTNKQIRAALHKSGVHQFSTDGDLINYVRRASRRQG